MTFHLVTPVPTVDFEYVVARVTPCLTTEGGIRVDIDPTCYACIRWRDVPTLLGRVRGCIAWWPIYRWLPVR